MGCSASNIEIHVAVKVVEVFLLHTTDIMVNDNIIRRKNKSLYLEQGQTVGPREAGGSGQAATTGA